MNLFVWFGIFAIIAIVSIIGSWLFWDRISVLDNIMNVIFVVATVLAVIAFVCGIAVVQDEHNMPYKVMENKIRKKQLESYIENVEYPKALEQMYFDDILKFNRSVHYAEKYGDRWMLRWLAYNPSYIGVEPIELEATA